MALCMAALVNLSGLVLLPTASAQAPTQVTAEAASEATSSILVTNVSGLDLVAGTFQATFYLSLTCATPCQPSEWEIVNARSMTRTLVSEEGGTTWWQVLGTFTFTPDLALFPFDTQNLPIAIEHSLLDAGQLTFVADEATSAVADEVAISGWELEDFTLTTATQPYASLQQDYSRLTFTLPVTRSTLASVTKFYIPLAIFILLGTATLVLARNDYQVRTGGTALLGLTVFYLASSGGAGFTGALTVWDASVLLGYLALGLVLTAGIIGSYRYNEGAFDGPDGAAVNKRLRFRFLYAVIALVAVGAVLITATALLT
jgi:hypothetical protein